MDAIQQAFVVESRELLREMEDRLLQMENGAVDAETINAIFRAAHTIKGGAGVVECGFIVEFTHVLESVLDEMRAGKIVPGSELAEVLLACSDHLDTLIGCVEHGAGPSREDEYTSGLLRERLQRYLGKSVTALAVREEEVEVLGGADMETGNWHISLRFGRDVLRKGMDPASFLNYLRELGQIVGITTLPDAIPEAAEMDPESCYLGFEISYRTGADKSRIESVFDFVRDDCIVHIWPPHSKLADFVAAIASLPEDNMRLGEILLKCGALTPRELEQALAVQAQPPADAAPAHRLGEVLVEQGVVTPEIVEAAAARQTMVSEKKSLEAQLIRVQASKLDQLVDMVGELVIAAAGISLIAQRAGVADMQEAASTLSRLVEEVRGGALNLRMVQIGDTFNRFQRVVRDVARELGKDIALEISGADTELDKLVVEKIADPLMHLVRNAMDHGIEDAAQRAARGKPARGSVRLNAYHESGSVVIEVADDGGGLNRERILAKAIERGLVQPSQSLSEQEIYKLIFEAGFSTADKVSNLSGRGVGMDVVRRNIEALRGTVEITSQPGAGTTMRIRLPLTLAIIDGFLVGVGKSSFVVPLDMVVECVDLSEKDRASLGERSYINLRGEVLPCVRLREMFDIDAVAARRQSVVVVQYGAMRAGMVVDALLGEFQTVIKPLGKIFEGMQGIGGSTILGSGEVALILDVPSLVQQAAGHETQAVDLAGRAMLDMTRSALTFN